MLMKASEPAFMTAEQAATRQYGYASRSELALRNALEQFCRERWPQARVCHEMVMGARQVRADVVAIDPGHIAAFEVKGEYDSSLRLLHQVGMYQLCVPEVWMVVTDRHSEDAGLIRHLLPSVGLLEAPALFRSTRYSETPTVDVVALSVRAEAAPRPPQVDMMLEMMWAAELTAMCDRLRIDRGKRPTRPAMIKQLRELPLAELLRECCTELRRRDALWRADAPMTHSSGERA